MNPSQLLAMMQEGAIVKLFVHHQKIGRKRNQHVIIFPDGTTLNTQASVLIPLVRDGKVKSRAWFGGSLGDVIYKVVEE